MKQINPSIKRNVFNIILVTVAVVAHVALIMALYFAYRYFSIHPSLIGSLVAIVACLVIIIDIVMIVGIGYRDFVLKVISLVLALFIAIGGSVGAYYINKVNKTVDTVIDVKPSGDTKYETVYGVYVVRNEDADKYTTLKDLNKKTVGYVTESETGVATVGQDLLTQEGIDFGAVAYQTNDELILALDEGKIDCAILLDGYRGLYEKAATEGSASSLTGVITGFTDFYPFEKEIEVGAKEDAKNIATEPFNILLIGYSRTEIGSPIGLADAIIVASVNPKTYTVSMLSIARDAYVPISCYGGTKDKINSGRSTSRACFIKTVEDYTGMTMDYYMEADYEAVVGVVDAIEGIVITNPVEFTLDGIYVPEGTYNAWGWQVLQFCRERHHMPNGDFDRQQHQKEVIIAIAEKLLKKGDITLFLKAIEAAGDKFSTDLTLNQLTSMFNMILNTKNYTGLKVTKLIDFHQQRLTGYADWYYNYSYNLPLWIYKIYQGSYDESMAHAHEVLGVNVDTSNQVYSISYDVNNPYERDPFYSLYYDEKEEHEVMPLYYPNFVGMSLDEAKQWAESNGVTLNFNYIDPYSAEYDETRDGLVVGQSLRYGILVSSGANTLTIMGDGKFRIIFPEYGDWSVDDAIVWCKEKGYAFSYKEEVTTDSDKNRKVVSMTQQEDDSVMIVYYRLGVEVPDFTGSVPNGSKYEKNGITITYKIVEGETAPEAGKKGVVYSQSIEKGKVLTENATITLTVYKCNHTFGGWTQTTAPTCTTAGVETRKCSQCGTVETREVAALGHSYGDWTIVTPATCTAEGVQQHACSRCNNVEQASIPMIAHTYPENWSVEKEATCTQTGLKYKLCTVCGGGRIEETIPLKEHSFSESTGTCEGSTETSLTRTCTVCGYSEVTRACPVPPPANEPESGNGAGVQGDEPQQN